MVSTPSTHQPGHAQITCSTQFGAHRLDALRALGLDIVHVCQQLVPCVLTWSLVAGVHMPWALALIRVQVELLAHGNTDLIEGVLHHGTVMQVLALASLADLHDLVSVLLEG